MENLRLLAVVDRVVAWHNRHPLARRISAAQVHAVGYVALPFTAEAPPAAAPRPAEAAAQAIAAAAAAAAAEPLPVLTEVAPMAEPAAAAAASSAASLGEGSRLRERALARAREQGPAAQAADSAAAYLSTLSPATLQPAFSEDFIDPLSPRQVARYAQKHGRVLARPPQDGPVREVLIDTALIARQSQAAPARWPVSVYLLTAVIETDTRKSRVLLGLGPAVLGRRIHSQPRVAALAALSAGLLGAPLWLLRPAAPVAAGATLLPATSQAAASAAASAPAAWAAVAPASAVAVADAAADAAAPGAGPASSAAASVALTPALTPGLATAPAESPAQPAATPLPAAAQADASNTAPAQPPEPATEDPRRRRGVNIVPMLSEAAKEQARAERRALMEAAAPPAAPAPAPAPLPAPPPEATPPPAPNPRAPAPPPIPAPAPARAPAAPVAAPRAPAAVPLSGPVFAISTRPLRTRAEADQVQAAMQSLLAGAGPAGLRVEVMPEGDDWRVVAMPYTRSADAERGRALLASRGMRVKVVDF